MLNFIHTVILYILFESSVYYVNNKNNDHNDNKLYFYKQSSPRLSINEESTNTNTYLSTLSY